MCVLSMVYDYYKPLVPDVTVSPIEPFDLDKWRKMLDDFAKAKSAAEQVDTLTGKPDCADPEKKKLEEKIARLEKVIDALLAEREARP